jgi:hypothetical protein
MSWSSFTFSKKNQPRLTLPQYLFIAFLTILATATGWEIIKRFNTDLQILFLSTLPYWAQSVIMMLILLLVFFFLLYAGWHFLKKFEGKVKINDKLP